MISRLQLNLKQTVKNPFEITAMESIIVSDRPAGRKDEKSWRIGSIFGKEGK